MILHSLATALRRQEWFTVVLEILIVVVGIFIGLQVDDWNQARQDRQLETRYLQRLQADLLEDSIRVDRGILLAKIRMQQARLLIDGIADPEVAARQPDRFIEAVEKVSWRITPPIASNVYSELLDTGRTALIESESLRDLLAAYYYRVELWDLILDRSSFEREYSMATAGVLNLDYIVAIEGSGVQSKYADLGATPEDAVFIAEKLKLRTNGARLLPKIYKSFFLVSIANIQHQERNNALLREIERQLDGKIDNH
jgi:hypothetical protein